jgi:hypothetical protein
LKVIFRLQQIKLYLHSSSYERCITDPTSWANKLDNYLEKKKKTNGKLRKYTTFKCLSELLSVFIWGRKRIWDVYGRHLSFLCLPGVEADNFSPLKLGGERYT